MHLEIPAVAIRPVPLLLEEGGEPGAVDGVGLGGDAIEGAGVDGGPPAGPGLAVRRAEGTVGDDAVVVEQGVWGAPAACWAWLWREVWWRKRAMTSPWARSWRTWPPYAAADEGAWVFRWAQATWTARWWACSTLSLVG